MSEENLSSKPIKPQAEEKPFVLEPAVLEAMHLVQQKAWPTEKGTLNKKDHQYIEIQVPFQIRRDILTFFTAVFSVLDVDLTKWFQTTLESVLENFVDHLGEIPISGYGIGEYKRKRLIERITRAEEDIQE